jgi:hypothetical protein
MSSLGRKLAAEFEAEFTRLANDWYLKWHELARGEPIELDDFHGGVLRPPSKAFDAAAEQTYWSATRRYIDNKIAETFARIESEIGLRRGERAASIAESAVISLRAFLERLYRHAVFTEYRLQARGYPDERYLAAHRDESAMAEVQRRKVMLLQKYHRSTSWAQWVAHAVAGSWIRVACFTLSLAAIAGTFASAFRYAIP